MISKRLNRKAIVQTLGLAVIVGLSGTLAGPMHARAEDAKVVKRYNDWTAYVYDKDDKKVCFVTSQPKSESPKDVKRGPIYFYISHWPKQDVKGEVSVKIGYTFRDGSNAEVKIGADKFDLFTEGDGAYVADAAKEKKLVDAMRAGSSMTVEGNSSRGTQTTDKYSLSGISAALDRINKDCS